MSVTCEEGVQVVGKRGGGVLCKLVTNRNYLLYLLTIIPVRVSQNSQSPLCVSVVGYDSWMECHSRSCEV